MLSIVNTSLVALILALFASAGEISWGLVAGFLAATLSVPGLVIWLIATGRTENLRDPGLLAFQFIYAVAVFLVYLVLAPQLGVFFLVCVSVTYNFAMLSFKPKQFLVAWTSIGLCCGAAIWIARDAFRFPAVNNATLFIFWLYFLLCLRQLSHIGSQFSQLRRKLSERNHELSDSLARLQTIYGQERLLERERQATELHDTLLQGINGMVLRLQAVAEQLPQESPARKALNDTLDQADELILRGRDKLAGLPVAHSGGADLPDALCHAGEDLAEEGRVEFSFRARGEPRRLQSEAESEAYRLGRDAMLHAFHQPGARMVTVDLFYGPDALELTVHHDSDAVSSDLATQTSAELDRIRHTAQRAGAQFTIHGDPLRGTHFTLSLPADTAYEGAAAPEPSGWSWLQTLLKR